MPLPLYQVDAFTQEPFRGNPAAVCVLGTFFEDATLAAIAREMNLSETAFVVPLASGFHLRWFTPVAEVDLCGHATLATAHVLWQHQGVVGDLEFHTRSGLLCAQRLGDWIALDFPQQPVMPLADQQVQASIIAALGTPPIFMGQAGSDLLVDLVDASAVAQLKPDFDQIARLPCRGLIVTAQANGAEYDIVSRFFAPQLGIPEDPVTGSAHCSLYPYWRAKLGKDKLLAYQASARGGVIKIHPHRGDRLRLLGQAVTIFAGELLL
ncbi:MULTISPECIES: PhzF family phenazine biosynthesis protein [unclassified Thermosynechococcus]|uniref:PhzF family phenazine biosynthesis protein n=1 Tax=unclassified Thermosynechococcus TaxID=2622553 RepID=UPI001CECAE95|nr:MULTISPECIES: PhzF family phenazine biosynthesis protein [unclassified Thermosynechococcus]WNC32419.1 PhzF family phenazine biosynthesis protein [Thermosynechococcus sp. PKX95]WNC34949.1 PhzF family phenazine biosynthesis protein [Thermosynechococcus sp. PKX91]WNC37465.1 PhzF family phenazine biosynthesis protein [Thermosynechococcus sp. WL11]WNC39987.1 PhzF family phenazine biosynthesis protein [Thermosynechococcus sp. WL17]WNC42507.1 PhzF family phenazine biosynthesis protein [Thermosynec